MYTYTAGATGLDASMPPWVQDGGYDAAYKRLRRSGDAHEDRRGDPDAERRLGEPLPGRRLARPRAARRLQVGRAEAADRQDARRGGARCAARIPVDTIMNLVLEDRSRVGTVYFMMSEDNIRKQIALPWVSFGSDAASMAPEPPFPKSSTHPRAYGNFARLLGKYVRDEKVIPLEEAIRRLSGLPATNLELERPRLPPRGHLRRRRRLRPRDDRRPRHVREAAPVRRRHAPRVRQRHAGAEGRRAHRREARTRAGEWGE